MWTTAWAQDQKAWLLDLIFVSSMPVFSPNQNSYILVYLDLISIAFFMINSAYLFSFPIPVFWFYRKRWPLYISLQWISRLLFLFFCPFFFPPFTTIPSLQPSFFLLSLSLSFLQLTPAQVKRDRWQPNVDTPRPATSSPEFCAKVNRKAK